ncbi:phosphoglucomutase [Schizosaccharomyces octosporus yFS286]|uniref:phosphopentomutase n=1 Tax=Schizosaccharomyces octosporus (strain yFS286) TaxID=483514 RepID=S9PWT6_SCHOY|nr:phosphoglucomutase [Schizosaccharomyces octosporus yFS286]EPX73526.1 phosphoglucomutase [Schizosaccharomyces octosporus yFS286]
MDSFLQNLVNEWLAIDQNETTRNEVKDLLNAGDYVTLKQIMQPRIGFGTSGLRAEIGAGFARMNSLTVIQASQGFAEYLIQTVPGSQEMGVVVGHDHRHNSQQFARLTAAAFLNKGFKVYAYGFLIHTPLVPFTVKNLKAAAGVMITASHNPAAYNGYKVYWSNGSAIIPPHDKGIATCIDKNLKPLVWDENLVHHHMLANRTFSTDVLKQYWSQLHEFHSENTFSLDMKPLKFVYTPIHGVGLPFVTSALALFGEKADMISVPLQDSPNPDFPTVKFPNPEEEGALDLAYKQADAHDVSYVLATDPDADRFAFAEKINNEWRCFTGDEVGCILAYFIFQEYKNAGKPVDDFYVLSTTVSSALMKSMAKVEGFHHVETLTGFKWLGNAAAELEDQGKFVGLAYEEALGYMVGGIVKDKDGVNALLTFLHLLKRLKLQQLSVTQVFDEISQKYGYYVTQNSYFFSRDNSKLRGLVDALRKSNTENGYPTKLGSRNITSVRDLTANYDSTTTDKKAKLPVSKSSDNVTFELENGQVIMTIRTSGTEPKLKYYICARGSTSEEAQQNAREVCADIKDEWFKPMQNGLSMP